MNDAVGRAKCDSRGDSVGEREDDVVGAARPDPMRGNEWVDDPESCRACSRALAVDDAVDRATRNWAFDDPEPASQHDE